MKKVNKTAFELYQGDITELATDAIVNAANNHLWMGAGVAGAIKRKGGQVIEDEAVKQGPVPVGEAVVTTGGKLKARYVIHAAGMGQDLKTDAAKIKNSTLNGLLRAKEKKLKSIAFPAIGTGVGGFSLDEAARIMIGAAIEHAMGETSLERIVFALFDKKAYDAFGKKLDELIK